MATTQPSNFPTVHPTYAYTTPPNSQGYQPYPPQIPPQQHPPQYPMDPSSTSSSTTPTPTPPTNFSPTSPSALTSLPLANRQFRPPKSPMFIPAALRPTSRPQRASPLTPPRSVHGSTDSLEAEGHPAVRPLSRRSTDRLKKATGTGTPAQFTEPDPEEPAIPTSNLPAVTGLPTRTHWKSDSNAILCDAPVCQKHFSLFERRHHCRHCGNVFCGVHTIRVIPLDQNAEFHPRGAVGRSCEYCWGEYERWIDERARMPSDGGPVSRTMSKPIETTPKPQGQRSSIAQSLTRDWNWSTF